MTIEIEGVGSLTNPVRRVASLAVRSRGNHVAARAKDTSPRPSASRGPGRCSDGVPAAYLSDATEARGLRGPRTRVVLPRDGRGGRGGRRLVLRAATPITPRGGGTGFAGGAVPLTAASCSRSSGCARVRRSTRCSGGWRSRRACDRRRRRLARENGLLFPPDPGAAEQSQIGGNVATNAGGPHAFKYGVTGAG